MLCHLAKVQSIGSDCVWYWKISIVSMTVIHLHWKTLLTCHHQGPQLVKVLCRYQRGLHKAYRSQEENISKEKPSLLIHWWQRDVPAKHSNSNFPLLFKVIQQFYQRWLFLSLKHRKSWSSSIFEIPAIFAYRSAGIVCEFQNWWITTLSIF